MEFIELQIFSNWGQKAVEFSILFQFAPHMLAAPYCRIYGDDNNIQLRILSSMQMVGW